MACEWKNHGDGARLGGPCIPPAHANRAQRARRKPVEVTSLQAKRGRGRGITTNNRRAATNNSTLGPATGTVQFRFRKKSNRKQKELKQARK